MEDFRTVYAQANLLYGIDISPEEFEEIGLIAWAKIGNKQVKLYRYHINIDGTTLTVTLPCNCDELVSVTYSFEDWRYTTMDSVNGDYKSQFTENYIEGRKLYKDPHYISGKLAKYERVNDTLYFDKDYGKVNILYKGIVLDDSGLPYINEKEKDAISCYIAYTKRFKEGWQMHSQGMLQEAQLLEQRWYKLCDAARVPESFTQNELNEILDVKTSWDRKVYNKTWKYIK